MDISSNFDNALNTIKQGADVSVKSLKEKAKIEEAAKEFEAVFVSQMLTHMFSSVKVNDTFGGGKGEEVFRSMMVNEYGKNIAQNGDLGIANHVKEAMIQMQEGK